jgi:capsular exopolysaccharide synthesis family protein
MSRIFEALQQAKSETAAETRTFSPVSASSEAPRHVNGFPELDQVPPFSIRTLPEHRLVVMTDEHSLAAEKIRVLSTRLKNLQQRRQIKKVLITSSISGEGKSVISANLALTLAMRGRKRTLLIGGDLRRPMLGKLFGTSELPGVADWWRGGESVGAYLRRLEGFPLWLLPAGQSLEQPLEILQSGRFSKLMTQLGEWFDCVIVDSPPLFPMADSGVWMNLVEGVLLVVRAGTTPKRVMQKTVESVEEGKLLGIVMNGATEGQEHHYYYYNRDHSRTQQGHPTPTPRSETLSP